MSRGRQKIEFEGLLQKNVLGTFTVIRGFADLRDLAEVSVSIRYEGSSLGDGQGYQRALDDAHIDGLKRFLQKGRYRFFPEIILGLRSKGQGDPVASIYKRRASANDAAYVVRVNLKSLRQGTPSPITRIDGNHRLEAAKRLAEEQRRSATFKDFATAPFCFVVLNSDRSEDDALAEAMLFNLINSLVIADLTDERPNVYCEVGYAMSRGIPLILTFHKKGSQVIPPWDRKDAGGNRVHFDLAAFRYIAYNDPLHLRNLLRVELDALFEQGEVTL